MRLNEIHYEQGLPVDGYGPGMFRIAGEVHEGPVAILPDGVTDWGGLGDTGPILAVADQIDVLLVGTGDEIAHLPGPFREALEAAGVGVETMNSPAAARSYNMLLAEGRRVALAALPI